MQTKNLSVDFLLQNQVSPEITINEAFEKFDSLMFQNALDIISTLPTGSNFGDIYIFSSEHETYANKIAVWLQNKGWVYIEPKIGWGMYIASTQKRMRFTENGWQVEASVQAQLPSLHAVALTGSYKDLSDKPITYGRNYIINGDFQIWQRGENFQGVGGSTRLADMWRCNLRSSDSYNISRVTEDGKNAIYIKSVVTSGTPQPLFGAFPLHELAGKTVTLSFTIKSNDTTAGRYRTRMAISQKTGFSYTFFNAGSILLGTGSEIGTTFRTYSATFTLDSLKGTAIEKSGTMSIAFQKLDNATNFDLHIHSVKLEVGNQATPIESLPYETQLDQCKKYFERINTAVMQNLGGFRGSTATLGIGMLHFSEKQSTPTITTNAQTAILLQKVGTSPTSTEITFTNIGTRSAQVNVTCADSVGENSVGEMILRNNRYIDISCEG